MCADATHQCAPCTRRDRPGAHQRVQCDEEDRNRAPLQRVGSHAARPGGLETCAAHEANGESNGRVTNEHVVASAYGSAHGVSAHVGAS